MAATAVALLIPAAVNAAVPQYEAESFVLPTSSGQVFSEASASNSKALLIWSNGTASNTVQTMTTTESITVRAKGDQCSGAPSLRLVADNATVSEFAVSATVWTDYRIPITLLPGTHTLSVQFTNDARTTTCDRNLRFDVLKINPVTATAASAKKLDVDPNTPAQQQLTQWQRDGWQEGAALMSNIASQPQASWYGEWSGDIATAIKTRTDAAKSRSATPILVAYNIPGRDCGSHSAGGTASAAAYKVWIDQFAAGLNSYASIVVLEPDALAQIDCLDAAGKQSRYELLSYAGQKLSAAGATVYIDAGHASWLSSSEMASRLKLAGISKVRGFSLNVSNFAKTRDQITFGKEVVTKTGASSSFVIDTSRNGTSTNGDEWCNPWGQALGEKPTTTTGVSNLDAYLWIKRPGESDGICNGGPQAGNWWLDYAMDLSRNATY